MTPIKKRNAMLAEKVLRGLKSRNMEGFYAETKEDALKKALELIPEGSSIGWGGSMSVEEIGLKDAVRRGNYKIFDRENAKTKEESMQCMKDSLTCDYFLSSTNAITEDGILINIDGNANRVAALCFGPDHVIMIVGMNKVEKNEEAAMYRARNTAAPINAARLPGETPCRTMGSCADCMKPDTICCQFLTTRYSRISGRIKVILVNENLGF